MLQRTEGIVLKTNLFGEADLIVTYITKDYGIIKTFAKSPRKVKSKFGSSLEPLTHSKISFWGKEDSSLPRLVQSDIVYPFHSLRSSLGCFLKVSEILELTLNFLPERDANNRVYSLLLNTLRAMEMDCRTELLLLFYKLKLLDFAGYLPMLNSCGRCGRKGNIFYLSSGTVLCNRCAKDSAPSKSLSPAVISLWMNLLGWDMNKLGRIKPAEKILQELTALIDEHVKYITERTLRTRTF
ncbi:MAG: DNA repair protein RecO [Nitrospira bacterium HGW-Nitrospira-1]|nr:MAG: DNA repair protein RecO [Nitrospira bacterium HGW-Nitrospira-1]